MSEARRATGDGDNGNPGGGSEERGGEAAVGGGTMGAVNPEASGGMGQEGTGSMGVEGDNRATRDEVTKLDQPSGAGEERASVGVRVEQFEDSTKERVPTDTQSTVDAQDASVTQGQDERHEQDSDADTAKLVGARVQEVEVDVEGNSSPGTNERVGSVSSVSTKAPPGIAGASVREAAAEMRRQSESLSQHDAAATPPRGFFAPRGKHVPRGPRESTDVPATSPTLHGGWAGAGPAGEDVTEEGTSPGIVAARNGERPSAVGDADDLGVAPGYALPVAGSEDDSSVGRPGIDGRSARVENGRGTGSGIDIAVSGEALATGDEDVVLVSREGKAAVLEDVGNGELVLPADVPPADGNEAVDSDALPAAGVSVTLGPNTGLLPQTAEERATSGDAGVAADFATGRDGRGTDEQPLRTIPVPATDALTVGSPATTAKREDAAAQNVVDSLKTADAATTDASAVEKAVEGDDAPVEADSDTAATDEVTVASDTPEFGTAVDKGVVDGARGADGQGEGEEEGEADPSVDGRLDLEAPDSVVDSTAEAMVHSSGEDSELSSTVVAQEAERDTLEERASPTAIANGGEEGLAETGAVGTATVTNTSAEAITTGQEGVAEGETGDKTIKGEEAGEHAAAGAVDGGTDAATSGGDVDVVVGGAGLNGGDDAAVAVSAEEARRARSKVKLGLARLQQGQTRKAALMFEKAALIDPGWWGGFYYAALGELLSWQNVAVGVVGWIHASAPSPLLHRLFCVI